MDSECKVYVDVDETRTKDGALIPRSFIWEDGTKYEIDRVTDIRSAASLKAGGAGTRYTVKVRNRNAYMYLEEEHGVYKWFMEKCTAGR